MQVFFIHIFDNLSTLRNIDILTIIKSDNYMLFSKGNFVDKEG
ncbi:hypothetical protein SAMN04489723_101399 [Algoriphagus aquimarinus]|mgnify:CR=1|uniref:Uncharacterized protein n=1 Tax=Algoriphagus aquimarinus TaxID=237018 RepID=A0A1I0VVX1_9BACT|nr:hypothetical protein SAMN04489723_101399 [Algoriphagus aquimarinus]